MQKEPEDRLADFERLASPPYQPKPLKVSDIVRLVGNWSERAGLPRPNVKFLALHDKRSLAIAKQVGKHLTTKTQVAMFYSYALGEGHLVDNQYFTPLILKVLKEDYLPQIKGW